MEIMYIYNNLLGCEYMLDEILKWIKGILMLMLCLIIVERFFLSITIVQGMSMNPTLKNNDTLFVNRIIYMFHQPHYGDIIIFHPPIKERKEELFVKRIIAVEGDEFYIEDGKLYINGHEVEETYTNEKYYKDRNYKVTNGKVPKGMVFVMGDNRNDSNDSRCFGFVPKESIEGKAHFRIWPLHTIQAFSVDQ